MTGDANLLLRFSGDSAEARGALDELEARLEVFSHQVYNAKVGINKDDKQQLLSDAENLGKGIDAALTRYSSGNSGMGGAEKGIRTRLEGIKNDYQRWQGELKVAASGAPGALGFDEIARGINKVHTEFGKLNTVMRGGSDAKQALQPLINIVKDLPLAGEKLGSFIGNLASQFGQLSADSGGGFSGFLKAGVQGLNSLAQAAGQAGESIPLIGGALGMVGSAGLAAIPVLAAVVQVIGMLVAMATALLASLVAAAGGLLLLANAFAVTLGPALLVVLAAFKELSDAMQGGMQDAQNQKQDAQALADAYTQLTQAERAYAQARYSAAQQVQSATHQLSIDQRTVVDDQRSLQEATVNAYTAWRDAIENVRQSIIGVESAQLGLQDANLQVEQAKLHLRELEGIAGQAGQAFVNAIQRIQNVGFNNRAELMKLLPTVGALPGDNQQQIDLKQAILDVAHAYLGVQTAQDGVTQSRNKLSDAQRQAQQYEQHGIEANQQYRSAVKQLSDAQYALAQQTIATNRILQQGVNNNPQVIDSLIALRKAHQGIAQALQKQATDQAALNDSERQLYGDLKDFTNFLKTVMQPVVDAVFKGLEQALSPLKGLLSTLQPVLVQLGAAIGRSIVTFVQYLAQPAVARSLQQLITNSAKLVTLLAQVFGPLMEILVNLANAVFPKLAAAIQNTANWLNQVAVNTQTLTAGNRTIKILLDSWDAWWFMIKEVGKALLSFFVDLAPFGNAFVHWVGQGAQRLAAWANSKKGRDDIKQFMERILPEAEQFATTIWRIIQFFIQLANFLNVTLGPIITPIWKGFNDLLSVINNIIAALSWLIGKVQEAIGWLQKIPVVGGAFGNSQGPSLGNIPGTSIPAPPGLSPGTSPIGVAVNAATHPGRVGQILTNPASYVPVVGQINAISQFFGGPHLAEGGIVARPTFAMIGEARNSAEAVVPLRNDILAQIGMGIAAATAASPLSHMASPVIRSTRGGARPIAIDKVVLPAMPGNDTIDPVHAAVAFSRELSRRGATGG